MKTAWLVNSILKWKHSDYTNQQSYKFSHINGADITNNQVVVDLKNHQDGDNVVKESIKNDQIVLGEVCDIKESPHRLLKVRK